MTDEEIEKGLYACGIEAKCEKCPYIEDCNKAINLSKDALDYINRLKAENAMLRISDDSKEKCTLEQHDEIHRLRDKLRQVRAENENMHGELMSYKAYIDNHEEIWKSNAEKKVRIDTAKEILETIKGCQTISIPKRKQYNRYELDQKDFPIFFIKNYSAQVLKANMKIVGATEYAVVHYRNRLPKFNNGGKMIFNWFNWERDGAEVPNIHPTQKPVKVLKRLIEIFTDYGDVVMDPCAGSGSTLRAAAELGRSAYGFEIDKKFYRDAQEKMLASIQPDIFAAMYEAQQAEKRQAYINGQISLFTE